MFLSLSPDSLRELLLSLPPHRIRGLVELSPDITDSYISILPTVYAKYIDFATPKTIDYNHVFFVSEYNESSPAVVFDNDLRSGILNTKLLPLPIGRSSNVIMNLLIRHNRLEEIYSLFGKNYTLDLNNFLPAYYESIRFLRTKESIIEGIVPVVKQQTFVSNHLEQIEEQQWLNEISSVGQGELVKDSAYNFYVETDLDLRVLAECHPKYINFSKLMIRLRGPNIEQFTIGYSGTVLPEPTNISYIFGRCSAGKKVQDSIVLAYWKANPKEFWMATLYLSYKQYVRCLLQLLDVKSEYLTRALAYMRPGTLRRVLNLLPDKDPDLILHCSTSLSYAFTNNLPVSAAIISDRFPTPAVIDCEYVPYPFVNRNFSTRVYLLEMAYYAIDTTAIQYYSSDRIFNYNIYTESTETAVGLSSEHIIGILIGRNYLRAKGYSIPIVFETNDGPNIDMSIDSKNCIFTMGNITNRRYKYYMSDGTMYIGIYDDKVLSGILSILRSLGITLLYVAGTISDVAVESLSYSNYKFV
jgi:hypothetical protein